LEGDHKKKDDDEPDEIRDGEDLFYLCGKTIPEVLEAGTEMVWE
jgi:hypothetical protein